MTRRALMQAGGLGERMARSRGGAPKPLVPVRGVPLMERGLVALLRHGFREIAVAVAADAGTTRRWIDARGAALVAAWGGRLSVIVEEAPLGTIGAAARVGGRGPLLVVNADNLTDLDLAALVAAHREMRAACTVAAHVQAWRSPLGELDLDGDRVTGYREKPELRTLISSGTYVLGDAALDALDGGPLGAPELVRRLLAGGETVRAFRHEAAWVDVNDAGALARAEAMVAADPAAFDRWRDPPDVEVAGVLLTGEAGVLLERRPRSARLYPGLWDTPGGKLEPGEAPAAAARREIREELGLDLAGLTPVAVFDDLDAASGEVVRHHVFAAPLGGCRPTRRERPLRWHRPGDPDAAASVCPVVTRSLSWAAGGGA